MNTPINRYKAAGWIAAAIATYLLGSALYYSYKMITGFTALISGGTVL